MPALVQKAACLTGCGKWLRSEKFEVLVIGEDESPKKPQVSPLRYIEDFFALSSSASAERSDFAAEEHFSATC